MEHLGRLLVTATHESRGLFHSRPLTVCKYSPLTQMWALFHIEGVAIHLKPAIFQGVFTSQGGQICAWVFTYKAQTQTHVAVSFEGTIRNVL